MEVGEAHWGVGSGGGRPELGPPRQAVHGGRRFRRQAQLGTAAAVAAMAQDARAA